MPPPSRSRSESVASSLTEMCSDNGEPEGVADPIAPAKKSKRSTSSTTKDAAPAKATKPAKDIKEPARRSKRATSQPVTTDAAVPVASKSSRKGAKDTQKAGGNVEELEKKMKKVTLAPAKLPRARPVHVHDGEYFNPLPAPSAPEAMTTHLYVWGAGNMGQFGMGKDDTGEVTRPKENLLVAEMAKNGKFGPKGAGLVSVVAGGMSSVFVDSKGTIWSCGANDDAALGRQTADVPHPKKKGSFLDEEDLSTNLHPIQSLVDEGFRTVQVAAGDSIGAAISDKGDLRVWGTFRASDGVLGFSGGLRHQFLPIPVLDLKSKPGNVEKFVDVAAGNDHVVVVTTHGNIYTWGVGERGQLGRKVLERHRIHGTTPERIIIGNRNTKAIWIGAGAYTSFAVDQDGHVWGWGANERGQTGTGFNNGATDKEIHVPKQVIGLSPQDLGDTVVKIAGGDDHTLFLTEKGDVYACGLSIDGRLGLPDDHPALSERRFPDFFDKPVRVPFPADAGPIIDISAGTRTSMAISGDGLLYMWGEGSQSELGAGKTDVLLVPTLVMPKDGEWNAVTGSFFFFFFLMSRVYTPYLSTCRVGKRET